MESIMRLGLPAELAKHLYGTVNLAQTAAGNSQSTAAALSGDVCLLRTVGASAGVILPADMAISDCKIIINGGANALAIYPPTGGQMNNASANAAYSLAVGKGAFVFRAGLTDFLVVAV
jgi:hypothetical protein